MMRVEDDHVGRWAFVKRWGWAVIVRQKPPHFWVIVASGWTISHPGKWKLIKVAVEDIGELGEWLDPLTIPPAVRSPLSPG